LGGVGEAALDHASDEIEYDAVGGVVHADDVATEGDRETVYVGLEPGAAMHISLLAD
jgi:hypothetical protein